MFLLSFAQNNEPQVYVAKHNLGAKGKTQEEFVFCLNCTPIPWVQILLVSIGVILAILLGLLIAAIVIININDYRRYQKYLINKKEAEDAMQNMQNPHFVDPNQETLNPMFQQEAK